MLSNIRPQLLRLYILKYSHLFFTPTPVKYYVSTSMSWGEQIYNIHQPALRISSDNTIEVRRLIWGICDLGIHLLLPALARRDLWFYSPQTHDYEVLPMLGEFALNSAGSLAFRPVTGMRRALFSPFFNWYKHPLQHGSVLSSTVSCGGY